MAHPRLLDVDRSALMVIDIQEAFRSVIPDFPLLASRASTAVRGFQLMDRPIVITEQYPKGLGHTAEEIRLALSDDFEFVEKSEFSGCLGGIVDDFRSRGVSHVAVCGIESHICVNQTVHGLLDQGFDVHILADAVASRTDENRAIALAKMSSSGAVLSSVEMALFELLRDSKHEKFKEMQSLIK